MTPTAIINTVKDDEVLKTPFEKIPQGQTHEDDEENDDGEDEVGEDVPTGECFTIIDN